MAVAEGEDWRAGINPASCEVLADARLEPILGAAKPGERFQFERLGYFVVDLDSRAGAPVYNRTVGLKDSWAKQEAQG
jgi:glutaminyl-tRNA synthetase